MLFADLPSLHLATFLMFFILDNRKVPLSIDNKIHTPVLRAHVQVHTDCFSKLRTIYHARALQDHPYLAMTQN